MEKAVLFVRNVNACSKQLQICVCSKHEERKEDLSSHFESMKTIDGVIPVTLPLLSFNVVFVVLPDEPPSPNILERDGRADKRPGFLNAVVNT